MLTPDRVVGVLLFLAGIFGMVPVDGRIAWACVLVAGLVMIIGRLS